MMDKLYLLPQAFWHAVADPHGGESDLVTWAQKAGLVVMGFSTLSGWPGVLRPVEDGNLIPGLQGRGVTPRYFYLLQ